MASKIKMAKKSNKAAKEYLRIQAWKKYLKEKEQLWWKKLEERNSEKYLQPLY